MLIGFSLMSMLARFLFLSNFSSDDNDGNLGALHYPPYLRKIHLHLHKSARTNTHTFTQHNTHETTHTRVEFGSPFVGSRSHQQHMDGAALIRHGLENVYVYWHTLTRSHKHTCVCVYPLATQRLIRINCRPWPIRYVLSYVIGHVLTFHTNFGI